MVKPVLLKYQDSVASFSPTKVERARVYGQRKRVAIDSEGRVCVKASLTADGSQVICSGMTSQGYFTSEGIPISRSEMVGIDQQGNQVEIKPSTLGVEQALIGPVPSSEILNLALESVFWLEALEVPEQLFSELKAGKVFRCDFNYTAGLEIETAYVLSNSEGVFALVGKPVEPRWVEEGAVYVASPEEVEEDELDFESM